MNLHDDLMSLLAARTGHFQLESNHHGELWIDLEQLCLHPERIRPLAAELARRLYRHKVEAVAGPLIEGAFVGLMVAEALCAEFVYSEPRPTSRKGLYPVKYHLPGTLRERVRGKRTAIVNDVINAGSAVRGTAADLKACGAEPVVIGSLLTLGPSAATFAKDSNLALETLSSLPNHRIWAPSECPLCAADVPLS